MSQSRSRTRAQAPSHPTKQKEHQNVRGFFLYETYVMNTRKFQVLQSIRVKVKLSP